MPTARITRSLFNSADYFYRSESKCFFGLIVRYEAWTSILCMSGVPNHWVYMIALIRLRKGSRILKKTSGEHFQLSLPFCRERTLFTRSGQITTFLQVFRNFLKSFAVACCDSSPFDKNSIQSRGRLYLDHFCGLTLWFCRRLFSRSFLQGQRPFEIRDLWQTQMSKGPRSLDSTGMWTNEFLCFSVRVGGAINVLAKAPWPFGQHFSIKFSSDHSDISE